MTAETVRYLPRHANAGDRPGDDVDARDHALALLAASPVYGRVARLLGMNGGADPGPEPSPPGAAPAVPRTEIAARLGHLPQGWHVRPGPGIDHLVVGPAGVFAVAVRHQLDAQVSVDGDAVRVNGRSQRWVPDLRRRAARLSKRLSAATGQLVVVQPVLAISGAQRGFAVKRQPRNVTVVNRRTITPYLHAQPEFWDADAVARVLGLAERLTD